MALDERGLSTVEYVIILAVIAVLALGAWKDFGSTLREKIGHAKDEVGKVDANDPSEDTKTP
jgi:Flp pilus assembly pilin Flp